MRKKTIEDMWPLKIYIYRREDGTFCAYSASKRFVKIASGNTLLGLLKQING